MGEHGNGHLFGSYADDPREGFLRRMWKPLMVGLLILAASVATGRFVWAKLNHGLHSGMSRNEVVAALGKPSCDFSGVIYNISGKAPAGAQRHYRPNLVYGRSEASC